MNKKRSLDDERYVFFKINVFGVEPFVFFNNIIKIVTTQIGLEVTDDTKDVPSCFCLCMYSRIVNRADGSYLSINQSKEQLQILFPHGC